MTIYSKLRNTTANTNGLILVNADNLLNYKANDRT